MLVFTQQRVTVLENISEKSNRVNIINDTSDDLSMAFLKRQRVSVVWFPVQFDIRKSLFVKFDQQRMSRSWDDLWCRESS